MRYVIGEPPRTPNEAFDALDNVFGAERFSVSEASVVLEETLDMEPGEARNELSRLARIGAIEEA